MRELLLSIITVTVLGFGASAQVVNIPDANFKAYLIANTAINTNADTEIQVSEATAFTGSINVSGQGIVDMTGIEAFVVLDYLKCNSNPLTSLDVTQNVSLTFLHCYNMQLASLDVSNNILLTELSASSNQLTMLDVSANTALNILDCSSNSGLTSLNLSNSISTIDAYNTALSSFNFSSNANLVQINVSNNSNLVSLNVANGNNSNFTFFDATNNAALTCIEVDNVAYSTANWTNIDGSASFSLNCTPPCVVNIPDANFKAYLVGNSAINTNADTEIQCSEASAFTGNIICNGLSISDLTGIEAFTALTQLWCYNNSLSALDVTQNMALITLSCYQNSITSLDITQNTSLTSLACLTNSLTSLNVANGNNTSISYFNAQGNPNLTCIQVDNAAWSTTNWTNVDVNQYFSVNCGACVVAIPDANFKSFLVGNVVLNSNGNNAIECTEASVYTGTLNCSNLSISDLTGVEAFTALTDLICFNNTITNIDVTQNTALTKLDCQNNSLSSLNVTQNTALTELYCQGNSLSNLNVSQNTVLYVLRCDNNSLTGLDLTQNIGLYQVRCSNNSLTSLNVANGSNTNISTPNFFANYNPSLTCIQVDDVAYSTTNWTNIDAGVGFSLNCSIVLVNSITVQGQAGSTTITSTGGTLQMQAAILPSNATDATYTWSVVNGTGSATINASGLLTALTDGAVTVTATANDGSVIAGSAVITISNQSIGINESFSSNLYIYPNPANSQLTINTKEQIQSIHIIDVTGKTVKTITPKGNTIEVSDLTKGIYFLQAQTENGIVNTRFIKQ